MKGPPKQPWNDSRSRGKVPFFALFCKNVFARNSMMQLVAGGGFEPPTFGL
jgi:hypothetical protein